MKPGTVGYLIKPMAKTIQRVKLNEWRDIDRWLGTECFDTCRLNDEDDFVYVDDMGLLVQQPMGNFFLVWSYPTPLAGNGLILGTDIEGDSINPNIPWATLKSNANMILRANMLNADTALTEPFEYLDEILEVPQWTNDR